MEGYLARLEIYRLPLVVPTLLYVNGHQHEHRFLDIAPHHLQTPPMSEVPGKSRLGRQPNTVALASAAPQSLTRDTVDVALETITIVKDFVPFEPARSALGAVCALLTLLQVISFS